MTKPNMVGLARERYYRSIGSKIAILFGISMAIYSILVIYNRLKMHYYDSVLVMSFVVLGLSIYILFDKNRNILRTMGLYCLGMALTRLPMSLTYIFFPDPIYVIFLGVFFLGIAINLLISAWYYFHGRCRGYITGTVMIGGLWMGYLILLFASMMGIMPNLEGTVFQRILSPEILLANVILFLTYLLVLGTDEIHDSCEMEISYKRVQTLRSECDAGFDSSISREDARKIVSGPEGWEKVNVGPVESELKFIVSYTDKVLFGMAQKWKDDDRIFFTIAENIWGGTMIEATRFVADEISCDKDGIDNCTHLIFRRKNGDCYSIEVLDDNLEMIL